MTQKLDPETVVGMLPLIRTIKLGVGSPIPFDVLRPEYQTLIRKGMAWEELKKWAKERKMNYEGLKVIGDFERVLEMMAELEKEGE